MKNPLFFLFVGALLCLASCADAPRPYVHESKDVFPGLAPSAPPLPLAETVPIIQNPQEVFWLSGYWAYDGEKFSWVPGHLADRPSPTALWSPERWEKRRFGWAFVPGRWH